MRTTALAAAVMTAAAASPTPSAQQAQIMANELSMFIHFSMCTFAGCEHDTPQCRSNPASKFQPTALDADQWVRAAVGMGAKEACLTAHHMVL